ncbi:MAG: FtsX-like permease family protein [Anaerolineales bacterium]|nr:FtsX-like permease family protein [Anaerolineales bacterium]
MIQSETNPIAKTKTHSTRSRPVRFLRWRKPLRDLQTNKIRTILVILSIAVGVFAFGSIMGTQSIINRELARSLTETHPASAIIHTMAFEPELAEAIGRLPEVAAAEGRRSVKARVQTGADEWQDMELFVIDDYQSMQINVVRPWAGAWPPPENELLIERNSLFLTNTAVGEMITLELPNGRQRQMKVAGLTHDMNQLPAQVFGVAFAYITRDTLQWLGLEPSFNELYIVVAENSLDEDHIAAVAETVERHIETSGREVFSTEIPTPGEHPAQELIPTILAILAAVGLLALILSAFLIVNTIGAILAQQVRQIGVMKSFGGTSRIIMGLYLRMVFIFGFLALFIAIPVGALGARTLSTFISGELNFDLVNWRPSLQVILLEIAAGLLVPLLAAIYPILAAARITIREAISDTGIGDSVTVPKPLEALLHRLPFSRPLRISLRNTFRRRGRLILTLLTLALGGAIFISVLTVRNSLFATLEETLANQGYDVQVQLNRPYRQEPIERLLWQIPEVTAVESWRTAVGIPLDETGHEGESVIIQAAPVDTQVYQAQLSSGRWLADNGQNEIVVHTNLLKQQPYLQLGGELVTQIGNQELTWHIVGITADFQPPIGPTIAYVNYDYFSRAMGGAYQTDNVQLITTQHDLATHERVTAAAEHLLTAQNITVVSSKSASDNRAVLTERFNIVTVVLMIMSMLVATVGCLGLMGTMSINVLERQREIGVMRAIGAADKAIVQIFITEGMFIGLLSWVGAMVISQPMSRLMSYQIGRTLLNLPLSYTFSFLGAFLWIIVVIILSTLASYLPANSAANVKVRETLAYE